MGSPPHQHVLRARNDRPDLCPALSQRVRVSASVPGAAAAGHHVMAYRSLNRLHAETFSAPLRYGTERKLTAAAGSVPDAHPWPPAVRGTTVLFNIFVRSTRATVDAPAFASTAMASPPFGL